MEVATFYDQLDKLFETGQSGKVDEFLRQSLVEAEETRDSHAVVSVLNEMAGYYRSVSRFQESIAAADRAVSEARALGLDRDASFGTTLLNAATAYRAAGQNERALSIYQEVLSIYERQLKPGDPLFASLYNNMSSVHMAGGRLDEAALLLKKALDSLTPLADCRTEAAIVRTNLAVICLKCGKNDDASLLLEQSIAVLGEKSSNQSRHDPHYAAALNAMAEVHYKSGKFGLAVVTYQMALAQIEENFGRNLDYAVTCDNCALAYRALGDSAQADICRRVAEGIKTAVVRK
jgi:tetratricopeptide (TPR) repeat protein